MKLKIRDKIIIIMVLLIILPILLIGWRSYKVSTDALRGQYKEMGTVIADEANALIRSRISETNKLLSDLSSDPALHNVADEENFNRLLEKFNRTKENYGFIDVYFGPVDGEIFAASGFGAGVVAQDRPWYIKATENEGVVWSEVYEDVNTGINMVTISKAVYSGSELKGVMAIDIDLAEFSEMVTEIDIMGGHPIVMDKNGDILIDKIPENIGTTFQAIDSFDTSKMETQIKQYTYENKELNINQDQFIMFQGVEGSDWFLATIIGVDGIAGLTKSIANNIIVIGLITVLVGILISIIFGRHLSNSINQVLIIIRKMEAGDFSSRIESKNTDEFGELRDRFNKMMETLSEFIGKIKIASTSVDEYSGNLAAISEEVNASSLEISTTAEEIAKGAANQADDTEEGVTLISNMSDKLLDLDNTSETMVGLVENIRRTSKDSTEVVEDLKEKTELNNESSNRVSDEILKLDRRIGEVGEILATIDQIAEQTNLLALNASIEAARAGEHGKGFAVVADEIRQLAGESKESSNNIKNIIESVQTESKRTVGVVGEVNERNKEQTQAVERVNESFETINNLIENIVSKIREIDDKSTEINSDRNEIVKTIENISAISEETAAASQEVTASIEQQTSATEEVANSASKLNELANQLNDEISVFKI